MLTFSRLPDTPKLEYVVDVEQRRQGKFTDEEEHPSKLRPAHKRPADDDEEDDDEAVVGGVSYEIHTDRDDIEP
jgi:hypothetical protein